MAVFKVSLAISNRKDVGDFGVISLLKEIKMASPRVSKKIKGLSSAKVMNFYLEEKKRYRKASKKEVLLLAGKFNVYLGMVNDVSLKAKRIKYLTKEQLFEVLRTS